MFTVSLFLCYAFISMLCCVYDFMLNVWSLREKKNEFQLFLFLRISCKECSERPQGVCWRGSKFYLKNLRRDIVVLITSRSAGGAQSHARYAWFGGSLRTYQLRWRLKDHYCKESTGSKTQITRSYLKVCHKECEKEPFGSLEFESESSGEITLLRCSKGDGDQNHLIEVKFRW